MNINEIKELILTIDRTSIDRLELENADIKLIISKSIVNNGVNPNKQIITMNKEIVIPIEDVVEVEIPDIEDSFIVKSPIVGTFYGSASPDSMAFVKIGDRVEIGQTICIIEAMKNMNEIKSDSNGEIIEILVKDEDVVEYGQPLMRIRR